ncbi:hypothetical protein KRR40_14290 [Niabella defluvii]|nr:hypothetical protein KRR40_14290 [Niabella sp. I65]
MQPARRVKKQRGNVQIGMTNQNIQSRQSWLITGFIFAILWPSAATATKVALKEAQPLVVAVFRFGIAAAVMLFVSHAVLKKVTTTQGVAATGHLWFT